MQPRSKPNRRTILKASVAVGAVWTFPAARSHAAMANDEVRLGFISCGGRAGEHMPVFSKLEGVRIAALCDPDARRVASKKKDHPGAKTFSDLRELIADKNIDAVVVATSNHWHCLASIWAMQAGKDVYVEKPLSHSQWEGEQTVAAARKYKRICQVGTQQRSDPMQAEIKQFLHQEKAIGKLLRCRVNRFGVRGSIGKTEKPLQIDPAVNYDLWLGPAQDLPIYRKELQYDWHWIFNTGSGEMGNWGVHVLDDARNNVFLDKVTVPQRIMGGGGRVAWNDDGETPNVHFVYFDTGEVPTIIGLSNLSASPEGGKSPKVFGPESGYVVHAEGGRLEGQRGRAVAFDKDGKEIRKFRGNSGGTIHQQNFINAVRSRDASTLNTEVEVGHHSTGWCNYANIAYRAGTPFTASTANSLAKDLLAWGELIDEMKQHLAAHKIDIASMDIRLSPMLELDTATGKFTGAHAETANKYLKREYRKPYVVPESV
jgi:predicted dehydrogenase